MAIAPYSEFFPDTKPISIDRKIIEFSGKTQEGDEKFFIVRYDRNGFSPSGNLDQSLYCLFPPEIVASYRGKDIRIRRVGFDLQYPENIGAYYRVREIESVEDNSAS